MRLLVVVTSLLLPFIMDSVGARRQLANGQARPKRYFLPNDLDYRQVAQNRTRLLYNHNPKAGGGTILAVRPCVHRKMRHLASIVCRSLFCYLLFWFLLLSLTPIQVLRNSFKCTANKLHNRAGYSVWMNHNGTHSQAKKNAKQMRKVPADCFIEESERELVTFKDRQRAFVIGSFREPCDHLVSLWSFSSGGKGGWRWVAPKFHGKNAPYDSAEDIARFRKWVRNPRLTGWVGERFRESYVPKDGQHAAHVDCWVYTEALAQTLLRCLQLFESQGGALNWKSNQMKKLVRTNSKRRKLKCGGKNCVEGDPRKRHHAPCAVYFDDDTRTLIETVEEGLFTTFGYNGCCGARNTSGSPVLSS